MPKETPSSARSITKKHVAASKLAKEYFEQSPKDRYTPPAPLQSGLEAVSAGL
jgi:hypothetical protein